MATWPSGKARDCKSSIPSSNVGVASVNEIRKKLGHLLHRL